MKKTLIIGFGISGRSAAQLLLKKGARVVAVDRKWEELTPIPSPFFALQSDSAPISFSDIGLVVLSPGIAPSHPLVQEALSFHIEVIGEIELAMRHLQSRAVGITGTNGKTTTTLLVAHILREAGLEALALGNTGDGLCAYLASEKASSTPILVIELSSFQLETLQSRRLEGAVLLNITPDHLDRYPSMKDYAEAKRKIADCLQPGAPFWVSRQVQEEFGFGSLVFDEVALAPISPIRYMQLGGPEVQNIQAAFALCSLFGVSKEAFRRGVETFRKPAHRIEFVVEKNGISFYNDSKGTNIDAVMHAVRLLEGPLILLVGGVDKGASYQPWIDCFRGKVKMIVAFGQAAHKMEVELAADFPFRRVTTMEEAFSWAVQSAEPKESVLLSPGCSSYDQFRNYEHRGDAFKRLVKGWV